jgi:glycosyltransferase involved in cell wall biosynthesis
MTEITVCAVVPTFFEESHLGQCIHSLKRGGVDQIIVGDGGSTDATLSIAEREGVEIVHSAPGRGVQLAAASQLSSATVIWMVHADCLVPKGAVPNIRACISGGGKWGAFTIQHQAPNSASPLMRWCLALADRRSGRTRHPYGDQAIFVKRELLQQIGGVPKQELMEDIELSKRLNALTTPQILQTTIETSSRRFVDSPIKTFFAWMLFPSLYRLKFSPRRLMEWYGS